MDYGCILPTSDFLCVRYNMVLMLTKKINIEMPRSNFYASILFCIHGKMECMFLHHNNVYMRSIQSSTCVISIWKFLKK
jgi:hypothetical protein